MDVPQNNDLSSETLTGAPPPPQEVKVRTMQSDLASMTASGGGMPRFQSVKIANVQDASEDPGVATKKTSLVVAIVCIVGVIIVLVLGYFVYRAYQKATAAPISSAGAQ